jgi:hypothetical protein
MTSRARWTDSQRRPKERSLYAEWLNEEKESQQQQAVMESPRRQSWVPLSSDTAGQGVSTTAATIRSVTPEDADAKNENMEENSAISD